MSKKTLVPALVLCLMVGSLQAEPVEPQADFRLIVRQSGGETTGINFAYGAGSDVSFFSNIDDEVTWESNSTDGGKMGTINLAPGESIVLGACAGGNCEQSFTSQVGPN